MAELRVKLLNHQKRNFCWNLSSQIADFSERQDEIQRMLNIYGSGKEWLKIEIVSNKTPR